MATKVKVYNRNEHPLEEIFKGEQVIIAPHDYWRDKKGVVKEMDIYEANDFRGQYHAVPSDGSDKMIHDPKYFKMITLEPILDGATAVEEPTETGLKCMAKECKHTSPSPEELEAHIKVRHPNAEKLVLPEIDTEIRKKNKTA